MILGVLPEQGGSINNLACSGQDQRFIHYYLKQYSKAFDRVYYFSYDNEQHFISNNCSVIPNPGYHRWLYAFFLPFIYQKLFIQCNVFRVMQATGCIPAMIAKTFYRKPYVITYGYNYFMHARQDGMKYRPYIFTIRAMLGSIYADRVIVTSQSMIDHVSRFLPKTKIFHLPNSVDTNQFLPSKRLYTNGLINILYVGRLSPGKNLFTLLDAVKVLDRNDIKITVIGDGELREALQTYAINNNIIVDFLGVIPNQELPNFYSYANIFVLPSLTEGNPKVLLEAMSCGLPCIGSNVPGIQDLIKDGETGLLCNPTAEDLAAKIDQLISNPSFAEKLGISAREYIVNNFEITRLVAKEIDLLKSVASSKISFGR
jgi:glycosyltransferase involved in cell wall biosynthesis